MEVTTKQLLEESSEEGTDESSEEGASGNGALPIVHQPLIHCWSSKRPSNQPAMRQSRPSSQELFGNARQTSAWKLAP